MRTRAVKVLENPYVLVSFRVRMDCLGDYFLVGWALVIPTKILCVGAEKVVRGLGLSMGVRSRRKGCAKINFGVRARQEGKKHYGHSIGP